MRLSSATLPSASAAKRFTYDRDAQSAGIVHFGIGAFHRAHQAWYTDRAMDAGERDWLITGVSLRSAGVAEQMNPQDGLYALAERSASGTALRLVGSVREVLVASADSQAVVARIAAPETRIISFTVTEKGYCRASDQSLDMGLAGEGSIYRYLREGLGLRRAAGLPGLTLLSCDNLADNGRQLQRLLDEYLAGIDPALGEWVAGNCTFPCAMVDRIVPATTDADRAEIEALLGLRDEAAVVTEPFSQWVIEDRFAHGRPAWESVGAELVSDVRPYETAKLRMLNGAHSMIAYVGLSRGHTFVHEAIADSHVRALAERLMRDEAALTIVAAPGQDLTAYADALIARFANPALNHRLIQIAMDGSQKIPQRWLETLAANQRAGRSCPAILEGIAAWIRHLQGANGAVDDPRAEELQGLVLGPDPMQAIFGKQGALTSEWEPEAALQG